MFSDPAKNIEQFGLAKGISVADFGAGSGFYTMYASRAVGNGMVYAIDIQKDLLKKIKDGANIEHLSNVGIIWGDVEKIGGTKLRESSIDAVIVANILFQAPEKNNICLEAKRVLKSGGKVFVIDWLGSFGNLGPRPEDVFYHPWRRKCFRKMASFLKENSMPATIITD